MFSFRLSLSQARGRAYPNPTTIFWTLPATALVAGAFVISGCSEEPRSDNRHPGGDPPIVSEAGVGDTSEPDDPTTCEHEGPPVIPPDLLPECPMCAGARCVPEGAVPMDFRDQLSRCDADSLCVPDVFVATGGDFTAPTCRSVGEAEGRCLSVCLPQVAPEVDLLPQATCSETERCVPCYDPRTGESTGACNLSCDPGPAEAHTPVMTCCEERGTCVPSSSVPAEFREQLGPDSCTADGLLCAPNVFIEDLSWTPPSCTATVLSLTLGDEYGPGVCLPECLPALMGLTGVALLRDGCDEGFKCAPCLDPTSGEPSGACDL